MRVPDLPPCGRTVRVSATEQIMRPGEQVNGLIRRYLNGSLKVQFLLLSR